MLRVGVARANITPPPGMTMPAYVSRECVAQVVDDELLATALVVCDGSTSVAIIAVDLVFIQEPLAGELRRSIGNALGVAASHVLINASHTHCSPAIEGFQCDDDPVQEELRRAHSAQLRKELVAIAEQAREQMKPARMGTGVGEARVGVNRRQKESDGTVLLGENPAGTADHEVRVLRMDDLDGNPIAVVFAHGCHTVTMGPKFCGYSADYPGVARRLIEKTLGCPSLFLQANAGDINPIGGIGCDTDNSEQKNRLGTILGGEVLKVSAGIYTDTEPGQQAFMPSLAKIRFYPRVPIEKERDFSIKVCEEVLELPFEDLPSIEHCESNLTRYEAELLALKESDGSFGMLSVARWNRRWAQALLDHVRSGAKNVLELTIQAIAIGPEFAIVSVPAETFACTGLEVKRHSPFPDTLFLGYSNGCATYLPTHDAYPVGGWSIDEQYYIPDLIFQGYLLPTALVPNSAEMVVAKSLELLDRLHGDVTRQPTEAAAEGRS